MSLLSIDSWEAKYILLSRIHYELMSCCYNLIIIYLFIYFIYSLFKVDKFTIKTDIILYTNKNSCFNNKNKNMLIHVNFLIKLFET